ncbi:transposase [Paludibacterium sp. B53371]|uniref:REP-associated tyrosine transposase n=1 Tax=Paludibacterium sp. B53371 TaxID=2806263 RepID=UPI001C04D703|nr:transposase [Paludibacterium sp. B53371]
MSRPLRIEFAGATYHVTTRGNQQQQVFLDEHDRTGFLTLLSDVCTHFNWQVYAYCLMGNHYHLLLQTLHGNLSRGMRQLNGVYTQTFNRRHQRVGHVFQGRYHAVLVDADAHLLEVARYVVLNPVRAGLVQQVAQWRWSSYSAMLQDSTSPWLATRSLLAMFAEDRAMARLHYRQFVQQGLSAASPWHQLQGQVFLGDDAFVAQMQRRAKKVVSVPTASEIPRVQRRLPAPTLTQCVSQTSDRNEAIRLAWQSGGFTLVQLAAYFGLHYATISRIIAGKKAG